MSCGPPDGSCAGSSSQRLRQIDMDRFQDVLTRRLEEIEALSKDLLEVGTPAGRPYSIRNAWTSPAFPPK